MQTTFGTIVELTDVFCQECLNAEQVQRSRQARAAPCHKRPSPLHQQGRIHTWACGILYALGLGKLLFGIVHLDWESPELLWDRVARAQRWSAHVVRTPAAQVATPERPIWAR
jgi:hypothetical protein